MPNNMRTRLLALLIFTFCLNGSSSPLKAQWIEFPIGRGANGSTLTARIPEEESKSAVRVLVVNAGDGSESAESSEFAENLAISSIDFPLQGRTFPPTGTAYNAGEIESLYLWRWIGTEAFDRVIIVGDHRSTALKTALENQNVARMGSVPCTVVNSTEELTEILSSASLSATRPEHAATERRARDNRTPIEIASALSAHYGGHLTSIAYIPSLAVIGRQRLGALTGNEEWSLKANEVIAPWLEREHAPASGKVPGASTVAGYLVFADAFDRTSDVRAKTIVESVASIGLKKTGEPVDVVPNHSEMSDSVFMNPSLLAAAGRLTGDERYYQACLNHVRSIQKLCLRRDGLYSHSPLDEAAWGRGNGFPALGLALVLSELPSDWPGRSGLEDDFQQHLAALLPYQDATGMWHQVIDLPESYREFSCTCMITFAMLRGMRLGVLDKNAYSEPAAKGWAAIKQRIGTNGLDLTDVCTGTGKQKDLEAYFHRTAILGKDDRGGAMALMLATEQAMWEREREK